MNDSLDDVAIHHLIVTYGKRPGLPYSSQIVLLLKELQKRRVVVVYEMKEYAVVTGESIESLARGVDAFIAEGWKPQGGVAFIYYYREVDSTRVFIYSQALVR